MAIEWKCSARPSSACIQRISLIFLFLFVATPVIGRFSLPSPFFVLQISAISSFSTSEVLFVSHHSSLSRYLAGILPDCVHESLHIVISRGFIVTWFDLHNLSPSIYPLLSGCFSLGLIHDGR
jgi:hypothetical protein